MVAAIGSSFGELSEEHAVIDEPHHNSEGAPTDPELVGQPHHHPEDHHDHMTELPVIGEPHHQAPTDPGLVDHQPNIGQNEYIAGAYEQQDSSLHDQNHPGHDPETPKGTADSIA